MKTVNGATAGVTFKPVTHVIFDLDGVILDTEKLYTAATEQVTARYGHKFTWELKQRMMGTPDAVAARTLIDALGLPITPEEYMAAVDKIYEEIFPKAELMPGAEILVRHLHAHGIPMAIATSSKPASFGLKMSGYRSLLALFHHVVCSGGDPEVKHGKPHPDIFLIAASRFEGKPPPEKVLVFEDSPMGVTAALAAGMQVVMTPEPRVEEKDRRKATLCLNSLVDFKPDLFGLPPFNGSPKINTEKLYTAAAEQVTARYGHKFTWDLKQRMMGTPDAVAARTLIDSLGLPITPEEYMAAVDKIYEEIFPKAELMPGAEQLLRHLHAHGIPMAIATSSKPASFGLKMSQYHELLALFHHVICSGGDPEVKHGKPHPDIFLIAASRFEGRPSSEKVLVFEDSPMGVTAALAAGMQVVMTPEPRVEEKDRQEATLCLNSLVDFKPELFGLPPLGSSPQQS